MKECFIEKDFGPAALDIIEKADGIMSDYRAQGYDLSLRQLYYQFVSKNWLVNSERSYKNLGNVISDARLAGLLDWNMIKDRGRTTHINGHWDDPSEVVESAARWFQIDKWKDQPNHVEVMVEKQALEGVLIPVCRQEDVLFQANKGYSSSSALYEAGLRYADAIDAGKQVHIIYLGDHDPSGIDMTRDIEERASLFARGECKVHRVALNMDQVEELNPPENPAKLTDSRATEYIRKYGHSSWELDAIEPQMLAAIVRRKILSLRHTTIWNQAKLIENHMKSQLKEIAAKVLKAKKGKKK